MYYCIGNKCESNIFKYIHVYVYIIVWGDPWTPRQNRHCIQHPPRHGPVAENREVRFFVTLPPPRRAEQSADRVPPPPPNVDSRTMLITFSSLRQYHLVVRFGQPSSVHVPPTARGRIAFGNNNLNETTTK